MTIGPASDPLHNQGVTPSQPVPGFSQPQIGPGDQQDQQKAFTMPSGPTPLGGPSEQVATNTPSPMQMISTTAATPPNRMTVEQLNQNLSQLQSQFGQIQNQLQDSSVTSQLSPDHLNAMQRLVEDLNPQMRTIANETGGQFQPPQIKSGSVLSDIVKWVNGSQQTFGGALHYLSSADGKQVNIESMMRLQYSVQRASQRGELFASIISSTVSGVKTIMSTQLG